MVSQPVFRRLGAQSFIHLHRRRRGADYQDWPIELGTFDLPPISARGIIRQFLPRVPFWASWASSSLPSRTFSPRLSLIYVSKWPAELSLSPQRLGLRALANTKVARPHVAISFTLTCGLRS